MTPLDAGQQQRVLEVIGRANAELAAIADRWVPGQSQQLVQQVLMLANQPPTSVEAIGAWEQGFNQAALGAVIGGRVAGGDEGAVPAIDALTNRVHGELAAAVTGGPFGGAPGFLVPLVLVAGALGLSFLFFRGRKKRGAVSGRRREEDEEEDEDDYDAIPSRRRLPPDVRKKALARRKRDAEPDEE